MKEIIKWNDFGISSIRYSKDFLHVYMTLSSIDRVDGSPIYEVEFDYYSIRTMELKGDTFFFPIKNFMSRKQYNGNFEITINLPLGGQIMLSCSDYNVSLKDHGVGTPDHF